MFVSRTVDRTRPQYDPVAAERAHYVLRDKLRAMIIRLAAVCSERRHIDDSLHTRSLCLEHHVSSSVDVHSLECVSRRPLLDDSGEMQDDVEAVGAAAQRL